MLRRLALAGLVALFPAVASAQFAAIGPTPPTADNGDRLATTAWVNNFFAAGLPLANGKIFIGSVGGIATPQTPSGDCTLVASGVIICTKTNSVAFAPSATTDATNATNITSGTLGSARLPSPFTNGSRQGNTSVFPTFAGVAPTTGHTASFDANGNLQDSGSASTGTVTSIICGNGLQGGTITTTGTCAQRAVTVSACLTAGTACNNGGFGGAGTYTTPAGAEWIRVRLCGGGGGGAGSGTTPGAATSGTATTFGTLTGNGGAFGTTGGGAAVGGTGTGGNLDNRQGQSGGQSQGTTNHDGGKGGNSMLGWGGIGGAVGANVGTAAMGFGAGGGGAGDGATANTGGGGSGAGCVEHIFSPPSATYAYSVGNAGNAGTAGTGGAAGGASTAGAIYVDEH